MPRRIREGHPDRLLLDTHVWVWYVEGAASRTSRSALGLMRRQALARQLYVSPVSAWEIATLAARGRLTLSCDVGTWVRRAVEEAGMLTAGLTFEIATNGGLLGAGAPRDPADRLLIATARALDATLVTRDAAILRYGGEGHVRVLDAGA